MKSLLLVAILALAVPAAAPPAAAHEGYSSVGLAVRDDHQVFKALVFRNFEPRIGDLLYGVTIRDLVTGDLVENALFVGDDNFVSDEENPDPLFFNPDFHAQAVTEGVHFHLSGAQFSGTVSATGEYNAYTLAVTVETGLL